MDPLPTTSALATVPTDFSHVTPGRTRSACNRCHSQKLRCVRNAGQASCDRCLRLKTSCRFAARASRAIRKAPGSRDEPEKHAPFSISTPVSIPGTNCDAITADAVNANWLFYPSTDIDIADDPG